MVPDWLKAEIVPLAWLWRVARRDGVVLGFTSHDRDMVRDGLIYKTSPGMVPSAISLTGSLDADTMDVAGALTSDAITEGDLLSGRWDGAAVTLHAVNWEDQAEPLILVAEGALGTVEMKRGQFSAELKTAAHLLDAPVAPYTSPECRAELGDKACRVNLAPLTQRVRLAGGEGRAVAVGTVIAAGAYQFGWLRVSEGPHCGLRFLIRRQAGQMLTLARDLPDVLEAGTRAELIQGCDKRVATCGARFSNAVNFQGEPYLPGMDYVTRYPGS